MKNSVLGKIIDEGQKQIAPLLQRLQQIQNEIQQNPASITHLQPEAISIQNQLAGFDRKRQDLIAKIEKITGRRLLTYFSIFGSMSDRDSRIIEDFLVSNKIKSFDLLLDSPGGFTDASEKMIKICRMRTASEDGFDFRTIVVNQAKSAATLFALGSSKILLNSTAELGPVDPQIVVFTPSGDRILDSAHQIFYGSEKYIGNSKRLLNFRRDGDLVLLSKYDPIAIKRAEEAISHTEDIIAKRIYTNQFLNDGYDDNNSLKEELKIFTEHASSHSHGRPIYYEDIKDCKFSSNKFIQKLDEFYLQDMKLEEKVVTQLEEALWELTIRSLEVVRANLDAVIDANGNQTGVNQVAKKLFESSNGLILTSDPMGQ